MSRWSPVLFVVALACTPPGRDTGDPDTSDTALDTSDDTGDTSDTDDTAPPVPIDGYGEITGPCGVLDDQDWNDPDPQMIRNAIAFDVAWDEDLLSPDGQEVISDGNLNPGSLASEAIAMEVLYRCELADLIATEAEVAYENADGKKTDLVVTIDARRIGVSVTRAVGFPRDATWTVGQAETLLDDKLADIPLSTENVVDTDAWERQILFVAAYSAQHADSLEAAWAGTNVSASTRGDTIVIVTVTDGLDGFVYGDPTP